MIKVAKTAGFCYGVKRAVDRVYEGIEKGEKLSTLGDLIHNKQVVSDLESHGVFSYSSTDEIPKDSKTVIRTHGVGKNIVDSLEGREYIDLTCPFVAKIHKIVNENYKAGKKIIIVGDKNHPEVKGINGWCNDEAFIIYDLQTKVPENFMENDCCIVAQTTINREIFGQIVHFLKKTCQKVQFFDTICNATKCRQEEAAKLAAESDLMIIVGGKESSNTAKLYEIASGICSECYHVETAKELPQNIYTKNKKIGITAGASTPGGIIEEVVRSMGEIRNEENFAELFEQYGTKTLNNGDIVDGVVVEVRNNEVIVDLGGFKYNGQLAADQLTDDPSAKPSDIVKPGDEIKVYVVGVNDGEGKVVLSRKKIVQQESWNKIKAAFEAGEILEGKIVRAVNGGVIAVADEQQIFIPARQASEYFVKDLQTLVGTTVNIKLIEVDERRKRVVGSVRVLLEAARKAKEDAFWAEAEVGKKYSGVVKSLTSFGAFVDIGGVDGLVHISELSWNRIKHPSEVVAVDDVVEVYIKDINAETKKISLGYKKTEDNPWVIAQAKLNEGDTVNCKIVRIVPFGAFAEIMPTIDGLIHISEIDTKRIEKPEDVLSIGQEVEAKIISVNWEDKKISLSIKALLAPPAEEVPEVQEEEVVEDGEALVYSTDETVEVEAPVEVEETEE